MAELSFEEFRRRRQGGQQQVQSAPLSFEQFRASRQQAQAPQEVLVERPEIPLKAPAKFQPERAITGYPELPKRSIMDDITGVAYGAGGQFVKGPAVAIAKQFDPELAETLQRDVPEGSKFGQFVGSMAPIAGISGQVGRIPALASKVIPTSAPVLGGQRVVSNTLGQRATREALTGALATQMPIITDVDEPLVQRAAKTAVGGVIGGTLGAVVPPIAESMSKRTPAFLRGIRRVLNPSRKTFEETAKGRAGQVTSAAQKAVQIEKEMIGKELAPRASAAYKKNISQMRPEAMKQAGTTSDVIEDVSSYKAKYGGELPSSSQADDYFGSVIKEAPQGGIQADDILVGLREASKEAPKDTVFKALSDDISKSLDLDSQITGKGNVISKDKLMEIYKKVNGLFGQNQYLDRAAQIVKESIYNSARKSGIPNIDRAVDMFRVSRSTSKAQNVLQAPKGRIEGQMESRLSATLKPGKESVRSKLVEQLGPEADDILSKLGKGEIAKEEATRKLAAIQSRSSTRDYLKRKKFGAQAIGKKAAQGAAVGGGAYMTYKTLRDAVNTMKGEKRYDR